MQDRTSAPRRIVVVDAQASAGIDIANIVPVLTQAHQSWPAHAPAQRGKRPDRRICEPMCTLTPAASATSTCRPARSRALANVDAELVLAQPGGDVGMCIRENIRIDAQRKPRADPQRLRPRRQQLQLALGLSTLKSRIPAFSARRSPTPACPRRRRPPASARPYRRGERAPVHRRRRYRSPRPASASSRKRLRFELALTE